MMSKNVLLFMSWCISVLIGQSVVKLLKNCKQKPGMFVFCWFAARKKTKFFISAINL